MALRKSLFGRAKRMAKRAVRPAKIGEAGKGLFGRAKKEAKAKAMPMAGRMAGMRPLGGGSRLGGAFSGAMKKMGY